MFNPIQAHLGSVGSPQNAEAEQGVRRVFMVLHGFYGNLFLSKFATGQVENGEDQGIANAKRIWAHGLRDYDNETIRLALGRLQHSHPEFPPSCPQFMALCAAIKPREIYKPPAPPALTMSPELSAKLREEHLARAQEAAQQLRPQHQPTSGLDLLKQAIADAVATAGGDEASALLRLDRWLAPKEPA